MASTGRKRRQSDKKKRDSIVHDDEPLVKKPHKGCDRRLCQEVYTDPPSCFCRATDKCAGSQYTSRWYHLSAGQHYCNECFEHFYRSNKQGHKLYQQWSTIWAQEASPDVPPRAAQFMSDMWLPVWVQCINSGCGRWRKLPAHIELHHVNLDQVTCNDCTIPEDYAAIIAKEPLWVHTISYTPLLRYNEGLSSLLSDYFPEGVGISPLTVCHQRNKTENGSTHVYNEHHPFNNPKDGPRAGAFTPDVMNDEEMKTFPEWTKSPALEVYFIIRNTILALWSADCTQNVTVQKCLEVLSLRGVVRIWCAIQLPRVLHFMSRKGYVNQGMFQGSLTDLHLVEKRSRVIIIGAGASGIAAGRHLTNFGYEVTILEASDRIGGRVYDDYSLRGCGVVRLGAMFVTGVLNNPLSYVAKQCNDGTKLIPIKEDICELISERGVVASDESDKMVEDNYNFSLDKLSLWRESSTNDTSLIHKLHEYHQQILSEQCKTYTKEEKDLLDFHYSNLEFACGTTLDKVSACHWDHNDKFDQFLGSHSVVSCGLMKLLERVCPLSNVVFNSQVTSIEKIDDIVNIKCSNGIIYRADQVIVTIPLSLLKKNIIDFIPEISDSKKLAIKQLGAGLVEKVGLCFDVPFWRSKLGAVEIFGHISNESNKRGLFGIFYDLTDAVNDTKYHLITTISGDALTLYDQMTDQQVIVTCILTLQNMFPEISVPSPSSYCLSRWGHDPNAMMSYSYITVGGTADDYDVMSEEEMGGALHFAGEATNRQHPQSVTGAYLSGIREAAKIIEFDYFSNIIKKEK